MSNSCLRREEEERFPIVCLWLGIRGLSAHVGPINQTVQMLACYAAAAIAAGSGAMPPRITAAVC
jgi:hypothetical protein